jgi:hypothetical protein
VRAALDRGALELAGGERRAVVRTAVGDGVHGALDTEQRDLVPAAASKPAAALDQLLFAEYVGPQRVVADGGRQGVAGAGILKTDVSVSTWIGMNTIVPVRALLDLTLRDIDFPIRDTSRPTCCGGTASHDSTVA